MLQREDTSRYGRQGIVFGTFASQGNNLIGTTNNSSGWLAGDRKGSVAAPLNPLLGPLQNNGGPTPTMALLSGSSPALDAGISGGLTFDQRGWVRPFDHPAITNVLGGDGSDIGAYELIAPTLNIERSAPNVVLRWSTNDTGYSLESALVLTNPVSWALVPGPQFVVGSQFAVTNGPATTNRFYRLKK